MILDEMEVVILFKCMKTQVACSRMYNIVYIIFMNIMSAHIFLCQYFFNYVTPHSIMSVACMKSLDFMEKYFIRQVHEYP